MIKSHAIFTDIKVFCVREKEKKRDQNSKPYNFPLHVATCPNSQTVLSLINCNNTKNCNDMSGCMLSPGYSVFFNSWQ